MVPLPLIDAVVAQAHKGLAGASTVTTPLPENVPAPHEGFETEVIV